MPGPVLGPEETDEQDFCSLPHPPLLELAFQWGERHWTINFIHSE